MEVKAPFALLASYISYIKHSSYLISPRDVDRYGSPTCHLEHIVVPLPTQNTLN